MTDDMDTRGGVAPDEGAAAPGAADGGDAGGGARPRPPQVGSVNSVRARALNRRRDWRADFLNAFARIGIIEESCKVVGISSRTVLRERRGNPAFRRQFEEAERAAVGVLERAAFERAVLGTSRPIYQGGRLVGYEQMYSDTLLMFLLRARDPERFRERLSVRDETPRRDTIDAEVLRLAGEVETRARLEARRELEAGPPQDEPHT